MILKAIPDERNSAKTQSEYVNYWLANLLIYQNILLELIKNLKFGSIPPRQSEAPREEWRLLLALEMRYAQSLASLRTTTRISRHVEAKAPR